MKKYISSLILSIVASVGVLSAIVSAQSLTTTDPNAGVSNFCTYVNRAIPYGERSDLVAHLQTLLRNQYAYNVYPTGYFGPVTYSLVKKLQINLRINYPSGSLGPITLGRLRAVWCNGNVVNPGQGNIQINLSPVASQGYNVTLGWNTQNATSCTLNGESVSLSGSKIVYVTYDTTYKMVCSKSAGETKEQSLLVRPGTTTTSNLPVINFSISPNTTVYAGQVVYLSWSATNATSCSLNGSYVNVSGVQTVTVPSTATSYVLSCIGAGGTSSQTISLNGSTTTTTSTLNSFTGTNNNGTVNLTWSGTGSTNNCSIYRYTSLGPTDGSYDPNYKVLLASSLGINSSYSTSYIGTAGNWPAPGYMQLSIDCGGSVKYLSVAGISSTTTLTLAVNPNQTSYYRGGSIMVAVTVTNNTGVTQTYPIGSSSCPTDVTLKVNGIDFYTFTNQANRTCTADYVYKTIAPGESYIRSFAGYIPATANIGAYSAVATLNTTGTVGGSSTSSFNVVQSTSQTTQVTSFTGTNNNGTVNLTWSGTGSTNNCSIYRYTSLGPTDGSYDPNYKVLLASSLGINSSYSTSYIGTAGNWPAPGYMQLSIDCGGSVKYLSVAGI